MAAQGGVPPARGDGARCVRGTLTEQERLDPYAKAGHQRAAFGDDHGLAGVGNAPADTYGRTCTGKSAPMLGAPQKRRPPGRLA